MGTDRFTENPFPDVELSNEERLQIQTIVNGIIEENFRKYENFVVVEKQKVDDRRWKHVKSKDDLHIYVERKQQELEKHDLVSSLGVVQAQANAETGADLPVMLSIGTFVGQMDDLMFGVVNPALDIMRIKASYVNDLRSAAVLCPIIEPTVEDPFRSLVIKWMEIDMPLVATNLVKMRDYVYIEATGVLHFANGDRVGYHMLHSISVPQAHLLPNKIRGQVSICGFFRQINSNVIDNYSGGTVSPGGDILRALMVPAAATALLSATNYVYCGQMKKISWMLQKRQITAARLGHTRQTEVCVSCAKKTSSGIGAFGRSTCKLCFGCVCRSCKIRKRISFITPDGQLLQKKIAFCSMCIAEAMKVDAIEPAKDQAAGFSAYNMVNSSTNSDTMSEVSTCDK